MLAHAAVLVTLSIALAPAAASANASVYNGVGGNVMPVAERRVTMLSEDIRFHQSKDSLLWRIVARYRFVNHTTGPVAVDLGFPLIARIGDGPHYPRSNPFRRSFKVSVDGRPVSYVAKRHGCDSMDKRLRRSKGADSRFCFDFVHIVPVRFEPRKPVEVTYRYWQRTSSVNALSSWFLDYILETGSLWSGPIGSATFSFRFVGPTGAVHVHDKLFHRDLEGDLYDCAERKPPARCGYGRVKLGAGRVRLWSNMTTLAYRATCGKNGALYLRLHAKRFRPTGNLAIGYMPIRPDLGFDPWCPQPKPKRRAITSRDSLY